MSLNRQQRRAQQRAQQQAETPQPIPTKTATGPITPEGKAISSRNALRHGLTAAQLVLPWEDQAAFDHLLAQLQAEHDPQTVTETMFLREMAEQWWRMQRARDEEYDLSVRQIEDPERYTEASLNLYDRLLTLARRYATRHERAFHKNFNLLRKLQQERRAKEAEAAEKEKAEAAPSALPPSAEQFVSQKPAFAAQLPAISSFVSQSELPAVADPLQKSASGVSNPI